MKLICSYTNVGSNWYVGEFYNFFFNFLKEKNKEITFVPLEELAQKYNKSIEYNNALPSIFNKYNFVIQNTDNNKFFIHSWNDYAPAMLDSGSGISELDIALFSCASNLTPEIYNSYKDKYNIQPSFYLLECWTDTDYIEKYKGTTKNFKKAFFNGLNYGLRTPILQALKNNSFFDIRTKDKDFLQKEDYYATLSQYFAGLSLNGAATLCYRDVECAGLYTLNLREDMNIMMNNPLIKNEHYISLFDNTLRHYIYHNNVKEADDYINDVINNLDSQKVEYIIHNARKWYEQNCIPQSQAEQLFSFLKDFTIFA